MRWLRGYRRRNQIMRQRIVIGPTADSVQPRPEQLELAVAKLAFEFLQQEHCCNLLFQHSPPEKLIRNSHQKIESRLFKDFPPKLFRRPPQIGRIPSMRLDFPLEEPLHARRVRGRSSIFQEKPDLRGSPARRRLMSGHPRPSLSVIPSEARNLGFLPLQPTPS